MGAMGTPGKDGQIAAGDVSINAVLPTNLPGARTAILTVSGFGTHWKTGTTVDLGDPGIKVTKVDIGSATNLRATLDVTTAALIGGHNVTVTTPGAGTGGTDEKVVLQSGVSIDATLYSELPSGSAAAPTVPQGGLVQTQLRNLDYRQNPFDPSYVQPLLGVSPIYGLAMPAPPLQDATTYGNLLLVDALAPAGGLQMLVASRTPLGQTVQYISDAKDTLAPQVQARMPIAINFGMGIDNNSIPGNKQNSLYKMTTAADNYVAHVNLNTLGVPLRGGFFGAPRIIGAQAPTTGRFAEGMPLDTSATVSMMGTLDGRNSLLFLPKAGDHYFALFTDNLTGSTAHTYKIVVKAAAGTMTDLKEPNTPDTAAAPITTLTLDKPYYSVNAAIDSAMDVDYLMVKATKSGIGYLSATNSTGTMITVGIYGMDCMTAVGFAGVHPGQGASAYEADLVNGSTYCVKVSGAAKTPYQLVVSQDLP